MGGGTCGIDIERREKWGRRGEIERERGNMGEGNGTMRKVRWGEEGRKA